MRILVVEDDTNIAINLKTMLEQRANRVISAYDGETALQIMLGQELDMIVLDIRLPGMSGEEVLRDYRKNNGLCPVIVLTGHRIEQDDHIRLLQLGADDYLTKPYSDEVLWERIRAIRRRYDGHTTNVIDLNEGITVDLDQKSVKENGNFIDLTKKEFAILELLSRRRGQWISYEEFFKNIWNSAEWKGPTIINTHIKNLRKKLKHNIIETKRGFGFRIPSEASSTD